jgi:retron-type reverse transcriptase
MRKNKFKLKGKKLTSEGVKFSKKIASRFHDTRYYESYGEDQKNYNFRESQKAILSTPMSDIVLEKIKKYRGFGEQRTLNCNIHLKTLFKINAKHIIEGKEPVQHTNLIKLVSQVPLLIQAYSKIKKNKGVLTEAAAMSPTVWNELDPEQKAYINATVATPDGINMQTFIDTSNLLKKGLYPWGSSRRIYIPKPGDDTKMRPITIPPFMDRVVQQVIRNILESIYEPWFDKANVSFGFRPRKGTHDAITALREKGDSLHMAIEGDIEGAYDNIDKNILINILSKRIKDKKFLKLIKERLNYNFFDTETLEYVTPDLGVPQGGIDSPYLFNIYMKEFDDWIVNRLEEMTKKHKTKLKHPGNNIYTRIQGKKKHRSNKIKAGLKNKKFALQDIIGLGKRKILVKNSFQNILYHFIKEKRNFTHILRHTRYTDSKKVLIRFTYVRYADDWIILTNVDKLICQEIKNEIKLWLKENLKATLSEKKTKITNTNKEVADFLGFSLSILKSRKLGKRKTFVPSKFMNRVTGKKALTYVYPVSKIAGHDLKIYINKHRVIDRQFIKGYSTSAGSPKEISKLASLEPFVIIERYNSVIRGFADFYTEFLSNPSEIQRWIWVLRYSCLKTLCQKYKLSILKLMKKYYHKDQNFVRKYGQTICFKVRMKHKEQTLEKSWVLITYKQAKEGALNLKRKHRLREIFWFLENKTKKYFTLVKYLDLSEKTTETHVKDFDYTESIKWVNWRTMASFDMPCSLCWEEENVEMHHIRHVRKQKYSRLEQNYEKIMSLRNRKQIPLCRKCHMNLIHSGKYTGVALSSILPRTLLDNNILTLETKISTLPINAIFTKGPLEKGWKLVK